VAELGEFLHTENQMLNETLAELDKDLKSLNLKLKAKSSELCKSEEQVRHLVRINEQRHQQILYVKSGMKTLESKAKDIIFKQAVIIEKSINDLKDEPSEENDEKVFEEDIRKEIDKILHVEVLHDVPEDELSYEYLSLSIQNRLKLEQESKQEKNPSNLGKLGDQLSKLSKTVKNNTCIEE